MEEHTSTQRGVSDKGRSTVGELIRRWRRQGVSLAAGWSPVGGCPAAGCATAAPGGKPSGEAGQD